MKTHTNRIIALTFLTLILPAALRAQSGNWAEEANRDTGWAYSTSAGSVNAIATSAQLAQFAYLVNQGTNFLGATMLITASLDLSGHYWSPAGTSSGTAFQGTLTADRGILIEGLTISGATSSYTGLFGYTGASGTVRGITLANVSISAGQYTGGIVGRNGGIIESCTVGGAINGTLQCGGITGYNAGTLANSVNHSAITSSGSNVGGIAGNNGGTLANNANHGTVAGADNTGGIAGYNTGSIANNVNHGAVSGSGGNTGGIVGGNNNMAGTVSFCYWSTFGGINSSLAAIGNGTAAPDCASFGAAPGSLSSSVTVGGVATGSLPGALNAYVAANPFAGGVPLADWISDSDEDYPRPLALGEVTGNWADEANRDTNWEYSTTQGDTNLITNARQFAQFAWLSNKNDAYYFLKTVNIITADINLGAHYWTPVATRNSLSEAFRGTLTGGTVTRIISGLTIDSDHSSGICGGLVGNLGSDGLVSGLALTRVSIRSGDYTGGIVGYCREGGTVSACSIEGTVTGTYLAGGIVGYCTRGIITGCSSRGVVTSTGEYAGGIAGSFAGSSTDIKTLSNCTNAAAVSATGNYSGGIAGNVRFGIITACVNNGPVSGTGSSIGGIVGYSENNGSIIDCANNATVTVTGTGSNTGGIIGFCHNNSSIIGCVNNGTVSGYEYTGGIAGQSYNTLSKNSNTITNCTNTAAVSGDTRTGGIVGYTRTQNNIVSCVNSGPVSGYSYTGGIVGHIHTLSGITRCVNKGTITGTGSNTGGITGRTTECTIDACANNGTVSGYSYTAGIAGEAAATILNCAAYAPVTGTGNYTGGIAGYNTGTNANCAAYAPVTGANNVGGIGGHNRGAIYNCFGSGSVSGSGSAVAGIVGNLYGTAGIVRHNHWKDIGRAAVGTYSSSATAQVSDCRHFAIATAQDTLAYLNAQVAAPVVAAPDGFTYLNWVIDGSHGGQPHLDDLNMTEPYTVDSPVPVSHIWLDLYDLVTGNDYESAAVREDLKDAPVWHDYVAGTDPTNVDDRFLAYIQMDGDTALITHGHDDRPGDDSAEFARKAALRAARTYTVLGKTNLTDAAWITPTNGDHRFFKVNVKLRE